MNWLRSTGFVAGLVAGVFVIAGSATAQEQKKQKKGKSAGPRVAVVARNLDNPCGVAIQPETGHVFVSANKRIIRHVPGAERGTPNNRPEIDGFPTDVYGKGPKYDIGPLGLAFLGKSKLAVGGGELVDGSEVVRFYSVSDAAPEMPVDYQKADATSGPIGPGDESEKGEGNFYGLAVKGDDIFITCNGDDTKGWISKITLTDGKPGKLTPFIKSKVETNVDAPTGIAISPEGKLVVSQLGEINLPGDSLLTIYDSATGKLEKNMKTGLNDVCSLAYDKSGKLYAVDYSWMKPEDGGLFRLDVEGDQCKPVKLASLDRPTALAVAENGDIYVAAIGAPADAPAAKKAPKFPGVLLRVNGL